MKASEVKSPQALLIFIEGILNDFETGVSSKEETMNNILDIIIQINISKPK